MTQITIKTTAFNLKHLIVYSLVIYSYFQHFIKVYAFLLRESWQ